MLCHVKVIIISMYYYVGLNLFVKVHAGENGVIAGHDAGDLERHCLDG
jgi:hypothetical protein